MKITVSIAQMAVVRSRPGENLKKAEALVAQARERGSDMICFPEMWTTGYDWDANDHLARSQEPVIDAVAGMARRHGIWINGSMLALDEGGKASNASILFDSKGAKAGIYRKAHLFRPVGEDRHLTAGRSLCSVDTPWGLTGLAICYDIRFPELFRTYALKGARIILVPAAFPQVRLSHWKVLVRARAIENQLFIVAANQVGAEEAGGGRAVRYAGFSAVIDPWGETVAEGGGTDEELLTATVDAGRVDEAREAMTVLRDRRPELYELG